MLIILLLVLFLGPAVYYGLRHWQKEGQRKKRHQALARAYEQLVLKSRVAIEHTEIIGNRVLALDKRNKKLVVIDHNEPGKQELCIPLTAIGETMILEEKNKEENTERIFLTLKQRRCNTLHKICFFDYRHDPLLDFPHLSRRALHWKTRVDIHRSSGSTALPQEFVL